MQPFDISPHLRNFRDCYPSADEVARLCINGSDTERRSLARLWLSEGIPYAFRENPGLYEEIRRWLGSQIRIDPKEITLIGSARLGQSLSPDRFGLPFSERSDLDLTTVSEGLFGQLGAEFNSWASDFASGRQRPKRGREETFWQDNARRGPDYIRRGFIDSKFIPRRQAYPRACEVAQTMWVLVEKLKLTNGGFSVRQADVRAYRSWDAFTRQMTTSLARVRPRMLHAG